MTSNPSPSRPAAPRAGSSAFTLVELLTVIAIIAVLAAIIFPVFSQVQESARRGTTMSNLQKIAQAVTAYELDNREYPEFLFGPAVLRATGLPGNSTNAADYFTMREAANIVTRSGAPVNASVALNVRRIYSKSLYPEYIRDLDAFTCPNNQIARTADTPSVRVVPRFTTYNLLTMNRLPPAGIAATDMSFYVYDAFDSSPSLVRNGAGQFSGAVNTNVFTARYARAWEPILPDPSALTSDQLTTYRRQLIFRRPPSETFITMTTYHAPKDKVLVLWLNGSAKVLPVAKLNAGRFVDGTGNYDVAAYKLGSGE